MTRYRILSATMLVLVAGFAYAGPCEDRGVACAAAFSSAVNSCGKDVNCVEQAHHTYIQCLDVAGCSF